jgi:hypothetical protein
LNTLKNTADYQSVTNKLYRFFPLADNNEKYLLPLPLQKDNTDYLINL